MQEWDFTVNKIYMIIYLRELWSLIWYYILQISMNLVIGEGLDGGSSKSVVNKILDN